MTNIEMQYEFTKLIQEMDERFEDIKRPSSETIFRMLNYAIDRYIKEKYLSGPSMKENVQEIQYRSDDLRNLIYGSLTPTYPAGGSTYEYQSAVLMPDDYMFYIRSDSQITRTASPKVDNPEWTPNRVANYDEVDKIVTSPTNKPILRKPVVIFVNNNSLMVYYDRYTTLHDFQLYYLRKPKLLVLDVTDPSLETDECELALHTHEEIVKLAVSMYIDQYKTHLVQSNG